MSTLAYNLSSSLQQNINIIEALRRQLLLIPLSPKNEVRLKWEVNLKRIYWSLLLATNEINKNQIVKILSQPVKKRLTPLEKEVVNYKKALDYLRDEWMVTSKKISGSTIRNLYDLSHNSANAHSLNFKTYRKEIERILDYLQTGDESPVIQSGIIQIELIGASPFAEESLKVARLTSYLFLYKYGYDFRQMLCLEEYYRKDLVALKTAIESVPKTGSLTQWLEYYSFGILSQLQILIRQIKEDSHKTTLPLTFWKLNLRQKQIMSILENPDQRVTNKEVQKICQVSQITASRDLAKLNSMGLLFPHGKGRSVFYTRV